MFYCKINYSFCDLIKIPVRDCIRKLRSVNQKHRMGVIVSHAYIHPIIEFGFFITKKFNAEDIAEI